MPWNRGEMCNVEGALKDTRHHHHHQHRRHHHCHLLIISPYPFKRVEAWDLPTILYILPMIRLPVGPLENQCDDTT